MGQLFRPSANTIARVSIIGGLIGLILIGIALYQLNRSSFSTGILIAKEQPIPFSHKHHVAALGIDCRFCHTSAETSPFAGIPPTAICMKCHSILWNTSPMLEPVRQSFDSGEPLRWNRVHDLPDHVYFDHSIHLASGIGCAACHGDVSTMPLMRKNATLHMQWCLNCHRNPEKFIGPKEELFNSQWHTPEGFSGEQAKLAREFDIKSKMNCSTCHR